MKVDASGFIQLAHQALDEGKLLWNASKSHRGAVSKAYYAMFYAVQAAMEAKNLNAASHHGQISLFNEHFIHTGIFSKETGKMLGRYFSLRQEADYKLDFSITDHQVELALIASEDFISNIESWLRADNHL